MGIIDEPDDIRTGEELDVKRVGEFLKDAIDGLSGEVHIRQFPSGFSNLTYLISVGDRELVLRRPPFGKKAKTAHDMGREYRMLKALNPVFPYCPAPLLYSEDGSVMDSPFYVMERVKGIILRKNLPDGLTFSPDQAEKLCRNLMDVMCELHSVDYKSIGLDDFARPEGYVQRQVQGWSSRFRDAQTDDAPDFENIMQWLHDHMPDDVDTPSVIHNDFKFDNVVLDPDNPLKIIGVLDWEMSTIGDPLMDLGASLAYWINRDDPEDMQYIRLMPTTMEGCNSRKELVSYYEEKTGRSIGSFDFYYCFGLFRLAVIAQQIYYRFHHGQTEDKRFSLLIFAIKILEETLLKVIEQSDL